MVASVPAKEASQLRPAGAIVTAALSPSGCSRSSAMMMLSSSAAVFAHLSGMVGMLLISLLNAMRGDFFPKKETAPEALVALRAAFAGVKKEGPKPPPKGLAP